MLGISIMEPIKGQIPQRPGRRCPHMESGRSEPFTPMIPPPMMLTTMMVLDGNENEDAVEDENADENEDDPLSTMMLMMMTMTMTMVMWMRMRMAMRIRGFLVHPSSIIPTTGGLRGPPPGVHQPAHGGVVPRPRRPLRLRFTPRPLQTPQGSTLLRQEAFVHSTPRFRKESTLRHFPPFQSTAVLITLVQVPSMGDQACGVEDRTWIQNIQFSQCTILNFLFLHPLAHSPWFTSVAVLRQ